MSFPRYATPSLKDAKIESLQTQQEYLNLLRLRHQHWMSSAADPQIKGVHQVIADLIEQVTDHYKHLLEVTT